MPLATVLRRKEDGMLLKECGDVIAAFRGFARDAREIHIFEGEIILVDVPHGKLGSSTISFLPASDDPASWESVTAEAYALLIERNKVRSRSCLRYPSAS